MDQPTPITPPTPPPVSSAPQPRKKQASGGRFSFWRAAQTLIGLAIVMATLFTMWTPGNLFTSSANPGQAPAATRVTTPVATLTPGARPKIAIISGHMDNDSGATCPDGLTEASVNYAISFQLQRMLKEDGFDVDILKEFDDRTFQYQGMLLISIHNDTCQFLGSDMSGFKVAVSQVNTVKDRPKRLLACLVDRYAKVTGLRYHYNTITKDMTSYHAFDELNSSTTAAIIETGFLNADRDILVNRSDQVAQGIRQGILCFARNEPVTDPTVTAP